MIELNLIKQEDKKIDIDGVLIDVVKPTPMVQANLINEMNGVEVADIINQVETMEYYFKNIITNVNYKGVDYKGIDFFNMLNITDAGIQEFITKVISEVITVYFLSGEQTKK